MNTETYLVDRITHQCSSPEGPVIKDSFFEGNQMSSNAVLPELAKNLEELIQGNISSDREKPYQRVRNRMIRHCRRRLLGILF